MNAFQLFALLLCCALLAQWAIQLKQRRTIVELKCKVQTLCQRTGSLDSSAVRMRSDHNDLSVLVMLLAGGGIWKGKDRTVAIRQMSDFHLTNMLGGGWVDQDPLMRTLMQDEQRRRADDIAWARKRGQVTHESRIKDLEQKLVNTQRALQGLK